MTDDITVKVAGHTDPMLSFSPLIHRCGGITNGVRFANHEVGKFRGGWIVDFNDLERMYLAAKAYRAALETAPEHQHMWSGGGPEAYCIGCRITRAEMNRRTGL